MTVPDVVCCHIVCQRPKSHERCHRLERDRVELDRGSLLGDQTPRVELSDEVGSLEGAHRCQTKHIVGFPLLSNCVEIQLFYTGIIFVKTDLIGHDCTSECADHLGAGMYCVPVFD